MNISELFESRVEENRDKTALIGRKEGTKLSFGELRDASERAARIFLESGIKAGNGVLLLVPMGFDLYAILIALFSIRAVGVFIDPSFSREQIRECLSLSRPEAIAGSAFAHALSFFSPELRRIRLRFRTGAIPFPGAIPLSRTPGSVTGADSGEKQRQDPLETGDDAPALITFTSGSTGKPKGAVRSHRFLLSQHEAISQTMPHPPDSSVLTNLPIFLLSFLASGLTCVIPDADPRHPGKIDPAPLIRQIRRERVSSILAPPAFLDRLVQHRKKHPFALESVRRIYTGGGPVFLRNLTELRELAPDAEIEAIYGSTEAEPIAHLNLAEIKEEETKGMSSGKGLLAGRTIEKIEVAVLEDRWGEPIGGFRALPAGSPGEIVVTGPHVLTGYLNGIGDEETKFRSGEKVWHRTGDAGYLDSSGRLWLLGRCAAKIADGGKILYPFEVECAAREMEGVRHAAFFSAGGKRILAIETYSDQPSPDLEILKKSFGSTGPDEIRIVKKIPMDKRHNTKIDYPALRKLFEK